ncbi:Os03g0692350, partial [Oryza sativa Japonica Group]
LEEEEEEEEVLIGFLLLEGLVALVHGGHREQHPGAGADGAHQVGGHRQRADAHAAERRRRRDVPLQLPLHARLPHPRHHHLLLPEPPRHVPGRRPGHHHPRPGQRRARREHERHVHRRVERVRRRARRARRRGHVVGDAADGDGGVRRPLAEQVDEEAPAEPAVQRLGDDVERRDRRGEQHDGHAGGVEEADAVGAAAVAARRVPRPHRQRHAHALEVDGGEEDGAGGGQAAQVGEAAAAAAAEEGLAHRGQLSGPGRQQVRRGGDRAHELGAAAAVHRRRAERPGDDALAGVGGGEQGDAGAEPVPLLEELVEEDGHHAAEHELQHDEHGVAGAEHADAPVRPGQHVRRRLAGGDHDREQLLRRAPEKKSRQTHARTQRHDLGADEELDEGAGGDDGGDAELHDGAAVGGEDGADPVERVGAAAGRRRPVEPVERQLAAGEEGEERRRRARQLPPERDAPAVGLPHLRQQRHERPDQVK